ncbi:MAG: HEPN domain-containing protein [Nitrososphaeria archaeon]
MNNIELAVSYIDEARRRLKTAENALKEKAYAYCIRQSQESVELALKAALRLVGIEPPKAHDVGPILLSEKERFPEWFREFRAWITTDKTIFRNICEKSLSFSQRSLRKC